MTAYLVFRTFFLRINIILFQNIHNTNIFQSSLLLCDVPSVECGDCWQCSYESIKQTQLRNFVEKYIFEKKGRECANMCQIIGYYKTHMILVEGTNLYYNINLNINV